MSARSGWRVNGQSLVIRLHRAVPRTDTPRHGPDPPPSGTRNAHPHRRCPENPPPSYPPVPLRRDRGPGQPPLLDSRVADIGAGTGIATALLHARGAHVLAVEPGDGIGGPVPQRPFDALPDGVVEEVYDALLLLAKAPARRPPTA
ncbi:hypothetical protein GCM10010384_66790 [Streptomyces djakartensis]|uniref:Methyltransferase n=1 Tax=Streptomyces djakartensis TaxID=68193 RepID=A0ABQ3AH57_9ACTN|nr:hypothetical protein GCM10010384_66790 [Streptomyces djakartensis]